MEIPETLVWVTVGKLELQRQLLVLQLEQAAALGAHLAGCAVCRSSGWADCGHGRMLLGVGPEPAPDANGRSPVCPCGAYDERSHSEHCSLVSVAPEDR